VAHEHQEEAPGARMAALEDSQEEDGRAEGGMMEMATVA
jgi:hypothetical protein